MTATRRVAAIDCGTNSIRLLIADAAVDPDGPPVLVDVHREMRIVRLGEGVDATGRLAAGAVGRTRGALADYAAIIAACHVDAVRMTATSAIRDAANAAEFTAMVRSVLGREPEVIAGTEEARLSFAGAVADLADATGEPVLVCDIGGGSTELVIGSFDGRHPEILGAVSSDIGSVRITERMLPGDPPDAGDRTAAGRWAHAMIADALDALPSAALARVRRLVAVAGTATTVAAGALGLRAYDPRRIHRSELATDQVRRTADRLLNASRAERRSLGYIHPGRIDVIGGGALVLVTVAELAADRLGLDRVTVSEHDILDGIALSLTALGGCPRPRRPSP